MYRWHFDDRRRESLRAKLEARHGMPIGAAVNDSETQEPAVNVVQLQS
jgi:hypothetical protein